ncbi:hypothetical protein NPIL_436821 [Nephila pilipes]|uniref:Uncharacterized protein n=1 Tax=Nephila pilipes TaxID=299642 RepID=A0A8X6PMR2_NEPPI|nr:hypothetical protein NPIL_436821 [Nephila pilipes]
MTLGLRRLKTLICGKLLYVTSITAQKTEVGGLPDTRSKANTGRGCGDNKFTCNDGHCIQMSLFCDRYPDCQDGSDEPEGCSESCLQTQKQCRNGRCVGLALWCNGHDDCKDGSDEVGCT